MGNPSCHRSKATSGLNAGFERAQRRTRRSANSDERLTTGGKAKYLLSGVLVCGTCSANYVIADA